MELLKFVLILILLTATACTSKNVKGDWIQGTEQEQIRTIEKHFRGLDMAMVEIGYRYQELYRAGRDENWDYASYQLDKIKLSLEQAIERRPLRKASADYFLENDLPEIRKATEGRDTAVFNDAFQLFTLSCNSCHAKEKVSFFIVKIPTERSSLISR